MEPARRRRRVKMWRVSLEISPATRCNVLHHAASHCNTAICCYTLQHTARPGGLQHCNTLQHTAPPCTTVHHTAAHCSILQHTAAHCSTLQHTAAHCSTLQHTTAHCSTLQHTAQYCTTLQDLESAPVDIIRKEAETVLFQPAEHYRLKHLRVWSHQ